MTEQIDGWLDALSEWLSEGQREKLAALLREVLPFLPDSESAQVHFLRLAEASGNPHWFLAYLLDDPATLEGLLIVLGGSGFAARTLTLHPEYLELLTHQARLAQPKGLTGFRRELEAALQPFRSPAGKWNAMRRFRRRETIRLITADLLGRMDLMEVMHELSDLAEAILQMGVTLLPLDQSVRILVVAFGKLGARELNYSSDIDLAFFHNGETLAAERWARQFLQALTEVTEFGRLYRVDLRLRPYGATGPLSLSLDAAFGYYESVADPSERLALLKARAVAGDEYLARRFEQFRHAFVFGSPLTPEEFAWLLRMKARSEATFATDGAVKYGLGGIRDVEMTVQFLQLAFASRFPDLAVRDTLTALEHLHRYGLLTDEERRVLEEGYRFLRRLEHMLQIAEDLPLQALPTDEREIGRLARCMGMQDAKELRIAFQHHTQKVRQVYERVASELGRTLGVSGLTIASVAVAMGVGMDEDTLRAFGFVQPSEAQKRLHWLVHGEATRLLSWRERVNLMRVLPLVLHAISRTPVPDKTLARLEMLVSALGPRYAVLDSLSGNPKSLHALALLAGLSEPLCQLAVRHPEQLEGLLAGTTNLSTDVKDEVESVVKEAMRRGKERERWEAIANGLRRIKGRTALSLGFAHLCRLADGEKVGRQLVQLADAVVGVGLTVLRQLHSFPSSLAVLALGGWGSGELHFGSDLDVAFGHEGNQSLSEQLVRQLRALLGDLTEEGIAYRLDLRLRPTGQEGALSSDVAAWETFAGERFEAWMALAWTRLRFAVGDKKLGNSIVNIVHRRLYGQGLAKEHWDELRRLVERIGREHRPPSGVLDVKHSEGALWDIDLAVAETQLKLGRKDERLQTSSPRAALQALVAHNPLWQEVLDAYGQLREWRLWLSWIAPDQPPRFVKGDEAEGLLAWLDCNSDPLNQETIVPVEDALERWRQRWQEVTAKGILAGTLKEGMDDDKL